MDFYGLFRRGVGVVGVALVTFGVASQGDVNTASNHVTEILGGLMFLFDFGQSAYKKITNK